MTRILILGANGQVGWELQRTLATQGEVIPVTRNELDLTEPAAIRTLIQKNCPDLIVNAAAYTAVDRAETEKQLAFAINAQAAAVLAEEAQLCKAFLIHYSTDYVFDGKSASPYTEESLTNPLNSYGASKLAGETAIQERALEFFILRTSWVYDLRGRNFLNTMIRLGQERSELKIVNDQVGTPTWSRMIAEATASLVYRVKQSTQKEKKSFSGIYNLTSSGLTTWFGFAETIFSALKQKNRTVPQLTPIATAHYPTPAIRPGYSVLSNEKITRAFGITLPMWQNALELCLEELT